MGEIWTRSINIITCAIHSNKYILGVHINLAGGIRGEITKLSKFFAGKITESACFFLLDAWLNESSYSKGFISI